MTKCQVSEDVACPVCEQTGLREFVEAALQTSVLVPGDVWHMQERLIGMRLIDIIDRAAVVTMKSGQWELVEDQVHEICEQIGMNIPARKNEQSDVQFNPVARNFLQARSKLLAHLNSVKKPISAGHLRMHLRDEFGISATQFSSLLCSLSEAGLINMESGMVYGTAAYEPIAFVSPG